MISDCWQEKNFHTQSIRKNLRMLHLLRLTSLLLKVSYTCSALWNILFKTREWLQKVALYCVSFQKVCLAEVGMCGIISLAAASASRGFLGTSCSTTLLTLHPSVLLPYFLPPQINIYWQESRFALQKESQSYLVAAPIQFRQQPSVKPLAQPYLVMCSRVDGWRALSILTKEHLVQQKCCSYSDIQRGLTRCLFPLLWFYCLGSCVFFWLVEESKCWFPLIQLAAENFTYKITVLW